MKLKEITFIFEDTTATVRETKPGSYQIYGGIGEYAKRTDLVKKASEIFKMFNKEN